jgi:ABC-type transporter Mla subunit MlaD
MSDYNEHLISMAGGDGEREVVADQTLQELAQSAKNALNAYAEGYGSYKAFKRAKEMYDARKATP